ncbi:MAG: hypothetical protein FWC36_09040 [Spirochaetes bacterium]|nr:hypothetical protein [Spirochaetota bacterium]
MRILHRGKTDNAAQRRECCHTSPSSSEEGFVLLRGLITMFIIMFCLAGILFSLSTVSRRSSVFKEEVHREIIQRNEDTRNFLNK